MNSETFKNIDKQLERLYEFIDNVISRNGKHSLSFFNLGENCYKYTFDLKRNDASLIMNILDAVKLVIDEKKYVIKTTLVDGKNGHILITGRVKTMAIPKEMYELVTKMRTYLDDCKICDCEVSGFLYHKSYGATIRFETNTYDNDFVGDLLRGLRVFLDPTLYQYELNITSMNEGSISFKKIGEYI